MTDRELMSVAKDASKFSYSPYSRFAVGAALECDDGRVYTGCNVENAALGSTICAERTACCKAVSEDTANSPALPFTERGELLHALRLLPPIFGGVFTGYGSFVRQGGRPVCELPTQSTAAAYI